MDSTERFSDRVENYVKYRPSYPEEAIRYLFDAIGFGKNSAVADIGSGTGIFTGLLIDQVKEVYAVEPNPAMRAAAERNLKSYGNFCSISAPAEATTIPDHTIDFITVAQAFHWFDREACKIEFGRILKFHGKVVLVWNERLTDDDFGRAYEEHLKLYAKDYQQVNHRNITDLDFKKFFRSGIFTRATFPNGQEFNYEGLLGRSLSSSYVPVKGEKKHDSFVRELQKLFDKHSNNGKVLFNYETEIIWGEV